jgi:cytochrome c-type biogenesis protein
VNIDSFASQLTVGSLGGLAAFGIAFLGGVVAGFGPCVLPMLPAVFGYVTGEVAETPGVWGRAAWLRGLALSATFVLGMSLLFAGIGAAAAMLGHALLVGAWAYYVVAAICVALGLQMMGAISLPIDALNRFLPNARPQRRGFVGAFLFGIVFGVVASPCSTPILAAIATIAATRGSVPQGALLLFVFGLGKGVPLMLLGMVTGSLGLMRSLSRVTGALTKIGGVALIAAAAYLVWVA